jgi:hypothetical protein
MALTEQASPRITIETRAAELERHVTAVDVENTCSFARADRLFAREYHGRFLVELLQNAADAWRHGTTDATDVSRSPLRIVIDEKPSLIVANCGEVLNANALLGLGQIGVTTKAEGEAIGHKGIGFKSVLEISTEPEVYSGLQSVSERLSVRFDARAALDRIHAASRVWGTHLAAIDDFRDDELGAVPTLRFPQWVNHVPPVVDELARDGFDTVVRLPFTDDVTGRLHLDRDRWLAMVRRALGDITDEILLLLGTFDEVRIDDRLAGTERRVSPRWQEPVRLPGGGTRESVAVARDDGTSHWRLYRRSLPDMPDLSGEIAVGVRLTADGGPTSFTAPHGDVPSSPFHLFFPTNIASGLPFLLHGYFEVNAARTGFYEGSAPRNDAILAQLADLTATAVADTAAEGAVDLTPLADTLGKAGVPEDPHAHRFQSATLDRLDEVAWVPTEDDGGATRAARPTELLADHRPDLIDRVVAAFPPHYVLRRTGRRVASQRIGEAGHVFLASRAAREPSDLLSTIAALCRPARDSPWSQGDEGPRFRALLEMLAALEMHDPAGTTALIEELRGDPDTRLIPIPQDDGGCRLAAVPPHTEAGQRQSGQMIMARRRDVGAALREPPAQMRIAFLEDGLLDERGLDRARPLGVRSFTVDNVLERLTGEVSSADEARETILFLWSLLSRERRSEFGTFNCAARAEAFDPGEWFWLRPGTASDTDRDRRRLARRLTGVRLPARDGTWQPAGALVFGSDWADWLESGDSPTASTAARAAAYRLLETVRPDDGAMLAGPDLMLALLPGPIPGEIRTPDDVDTDTDEPEEQRDVSVNAQRHAFLLRLGVWETIPLEGFDNRSLNRPRFPWLGKVEDLRARIVEERGGWNFDRYGGPGRRTHQHTRIAEDVRFRWSLDRAATADPLAVARLLDIGADLYARLQSVAAFCPQCPGHGVPYRTRADDGYPTQLQLQLRHERWVPAIFDDRPVADPLPPGSVWWAPRVPVGVRLARSPLRFLTLCDPGAELSNSLLAVAGIPKLESAGLADVERLLAGLREEYAAGTLPIDPHSSDSRDAFAGLHRLAYERLSELAQADDGTEIAEVADRIGVLCDLGGALCYAPPNEARHDNGSFVAYRRHFSADLPFLELPRDRGTVAGRLGVERFRVSETRRNIGPTRDVTEDLADILGDRVPEILAIMVHHSLGAETLEPSGQNFEQRSDRLRNLRVLQVDDLVVDAHVDGTNLHATIGEGREHELLLEQPTPRHPLIVHDFNGEGWQDRIRRKLGPPIATVLENPPYAATLALFLLADTDNEREAFLEDLGITPRDVEALGARIGAVSAEERDRHRRWFHAIVETLGATSTSVSLDPDDLVASLVAAGLPNDGARRLAELGGGESVRHDVSRDGALHLLASHGVDLGQLDQHLRKAGDAGIEVDVARVRLRAWTSRHGQQVAAVLWSAGQPEDHAKAEPATWQAPTQLRHRLDPSWAEVLEPVAASLHNAGFAADVAALAEEPVAELARLARPNTDVPVNDLVDRLYDTEEQEGLLRRTAGIWRAELRLLAVLARTAWSDSRAAIRGHAEIVDERLPANPEKPSTLQPALDNLLGTHPGLVDALSGLLGDSLALTPPERHRLLEIAEAHGLTTDRIDDVEQALRAPRRDAARKTRERIAKLKREGTTIGPPPQLQTLPGPVPPTPPPQKKRVSKIKVGPAADERKRRIGDEGERWALAAVLEPLITLSLSDRCRAIDDILDLLERFEGESADAARMHAEPARAGDLDQDELIDELTGLLHVSRHSDGFGFDLLGWLSPAAGREPEAMCLEVKSSGSATFHLTRGEWALAAQFHVEGIGERYAVLVVRRRDSGGVPSRLELLSDPVGLVDTGLLSKTDDGYELAYRPA